METEEGIDLPYPFDKVWDTALLIIRQAEWKIIRSDKSSGGIEIHTSMDLITWTETFYIDLIRKDDDSTRAIMGRIGLGQPLDWGIARQFVEQFLTKLDSTLRKLSGQQT